MGFFDDINQADLDGSASEVPMIVEENEESELDEATVEPPTPESEEDEFTLEDEADDEFGEMLNESESSVNQVSIAYLGEDTTPAPKEEPAPKKKEKAETSKQTVSSEALVIPVGAVVDGSITCTSDAVIGGEVTGFVSGNNITILKEGKVGQNGSTGEIVKAAGRVTINGDIAGSIKCKSITFGGCKITGDIISPDQVTIEAGGKLVGDVIDSKEAVIGGAVKGKISSSGTVTVTSTGIVKGSIVAKDVVIEKGSRIQGSIERTGEDITDDIFN